MSDRDQETWFDMKPSHNPRPPLLEDARQVADEAKLDADRMSELVASTEDADIRRGYIMAAAVLVLKWVEAEQYCVELYERINAPVIEINLEAAAAVCEDEPKPYDKWDYADQCYEQEREERLSK